MDKKQDKKLNLGCGNSYKEGWVNLDRDKSIKADAYADLNDMKLPFEDNTFNYILFNHTIEHLDCNLNLMILFDEIARVLKKGGTLELNLPHYSHWNAYKMVHNKAFNFRNFVSLPQFEVISARYGMTVKHNSWLVKDRKWYSRLFNNTIEYLANIKPLITERIWCTWFGGFVEQRFMLKNKKTFADKYKMLGCAEKTGKI